MPSTEKSQLSSPSRRKLFGTFAVVLCIIAVAISTRRFLFILSDTSDSPERAIAKLFDEHKFIDHSALTLAHVVPSAIFILLALIQFSNPIRRRHPRYHRLAGTLAIGAGIVSGTTGIVMGFAMPSGGMLETSAMSFFGCVFLVSLIQGYQHARRKEFVSHQHWMVRAFAVASAIVTIRFIVLLFFITRGITELSFPQFFGLAQWIGFSMHLAAAEWWIRNGNAVPKNSLD